MGKYKRLIIRLIFFILLLSIILVPLLWQYFKTQNKENSKIVTSFQSEKPDSPCKNNDYLYVNPLIDYTANNFYHKKRIVKGNKGNDNYYFDNKKYTIIEQKGDGNNDTIFAFVANTKKNKFILPDNVENIILSDWQQPVYSTINGKMMKIYGHPTWIDLDYKQGNIPITHQNSISKKTPDKNNKKYIKNYTPESQYAYYEDYIDSKRYYYRATCGAVTALNVYIRYYGKIITEYNFVKNLVKKTNYLDKNILFFIIRAKIFNVLGLKSYKTKAQRHINIEWSLGGTNTFTFPAILNYKKIPHTKMGIFSDLTAKEQLQKIGKKFKSGEIDQACLSINFDVLYNSSEIPIDTLTVNHQIIITGAIYEINNDKEKLYGFYVADSSGFLIEKNPNPQIYTLEALSNSHNVLGSESILINKSKIASAIKNINVLASNTNNIIAGNKGNNILKGLKGDDIYIIGIGNDKTIDTKGNDIYIIDASSSNNTITTIIDNKDINKKKSLGSIYVTKNDIHSLIDLTKDISSKKIKDTLNNNSKEFLQLKGSNNKNLKDHYKGKYGENYFWNNINKSELRIIYNNQIIVIPEFVNGDLGIHLQ